MKSETRLLLLLVVASLSLTTGCDLDKIPLTPRDAAKLAGKFGVATRSELGDSGSDSRTYELMVESRREANWREADFALWSGLRVTCPDGRRGTTISSSPAERTEAEQTRMHPPGTLFRRVVTCPPPPDFEFALAEGLSREDVRWIFHERVNAGNSGYLREPVVLPVRHSVGRPVYYAIEQALGRASLQWAEKCDGNMKLTNLAVGMLPARPAREDPGSRDADAYVGFVVDCQQADPATKVAQDLGLTGYEDTQP